MEAGSLTIFLCALFIFSAEGKVYKHLIVRSHFMLVFIDKSEIMTWRSRNYREEALNFRCLDKMYCLFLIMRVWFSSDTYLKIWKFIMVVNERVGIEVNTSTTTVRNPAVSNRLSCFRDARLDWESGGYWLSREPYELWNRYKQSNEKCMYVPYVVHRKHGKPAQKWKWFPRNKTLLV